MNEVNENDTLRYYFGSIQGNYLALISDAAFLNHTVII
jgi:hypothetical protein